MDSHDYIFFASVDRLSKCRKYKTYEFIFFYKIYTFNTYIQADKLVERERKRAESVIIRCRLIYYEYIESVLHRLFLSCAISAATIVCDATYVRRSSVNACNQCMQHFISSGYYRAVGQGCRHIVAYKMTYQLVIFLL